MAPAIAVLVLLGGPQTALASGETVSRTAPYAERFSTMNCDIGIDTQPWISQSSMSCNATADTSGHLTSAFSFSAGQTDSMNEAWVRWFGGGDAGTSSGDTPTFVLRHAVSAITISENFRVNINQASNQTAGAPGNATGQEVVSDDVYADGCQCELQEVFVLSSFPSGSVTSPGTYQLTGTLTNPNGGAIAPGGIYARGFLGGSGEVDACPGGGACTLSNGLQGQVIVSADVDLLGWTFVLSN